MYMQMYKIVNGYAPSYLSSLISKRSDVHCYNTRQSVNLDLSTVKQPPLNAIFNFAQSTYGILSVPTQETVNPPPVLSTMLK